MKERYCICTYLENVLTPNYQGPPMRRVFDNMSFPDPDKDPTAKEKCVDRKKILEQSRKKSVKAVILTEILE
jgi:hypothetical protein